MKKIAAVLAACLLAVSAFAATAAETPPEDRAESMARLSEELLAEPPEGLTRAEVALSLGWLNLFDVFGEPDPARAVDFLNIALEDGLIEAGVVLGAIYSGGEQATAPFRDMALSESYYEKAAGGGSVDAMRILGVMYADGAEGIPADPEKSRRYLLAAAARGSEMALDRLAPLVEEAAAWEEANPGQKADFPSTREELVDPSLSEEARQRAMRITEATSKVLDAVVARVGGGAEALAKAGADGVRSGEGQEELWAKVSAAIDKGAMEIVDEQPDDKRKGEAALIIGILHYMGLLHGQDIERAHEFLAIALGYGVPEARVTLGEFHIGLTSDDPDMERDIPRGMAYILEAAEMGSVDAERLLGIIYAQGLDGVPADAAKSEEHFLAAARYGDFEALERLEPLFARAAEWEAEHPGEKSPFPSGPEDVIVPELAEKARLRGEEINAMVEYVNAEFEKKIMAAVKGE